MKILEVVGLTGRVGASRLHALSFTLEEGEILALCGPTGAGKTGCLRCLAGAFPIEAGRLILDGREVTGLGPRELAQQGLVHAREIPTPPWSQSPAEAVATALLWPRLGRIAVLRARWPDARTRARVAALLERVGLESGERAPRGAAPLARLALAQSLALRPRVLLLDEPLGRLPQDDRPAVAGLIAEVRGSGVAIVLAEREPAVARTVADRAATVERGAVIA